MRAIFWKELADHFGRRRFILLMGMVVLGSIWGLSVMLREVQEGSRSTSDFLFLQIFYRGSGFLPSLLFFVGLYAPLVAITLGFDAINSERTQGTLSRVLAQPVYRDAVFNGKFLAGSFTLAVVFVGMVISIVGLGMFILGFAPSGEEVLRLIGFSIVSIAYMAFWLVLAMTCSIFLRNTVASALVALSIWMFSLFFLQLIIARPLADFFVSNVTTAEQALRQLRIEQWLSRISPDILFSEAANTLLNPTVRALGPSPQDLAVPLATPISATQSLRLIWPHVVAIISLVAGLLVISYAKFMREEIRS